MHIYAASVALLWTTALRAVAPPRTPRLPIGQGKLRQAGKSGEPARCGLIVRCAGDFLASLRR
jgi:hypothetical protein